jgi:hypothetical protein
MGYFIPVSKFLEEICLKKDCTFSEETRQQFFHKAFEKPLPAREAFWNLLEENGVFKKGISVFIMINKTHFESSNFFNDLRKLTPITITMPANEPSVLLYPEAQNNLTNNFL